MRAFAGFCGCFADFCGIFAGRVGPFFLLFADSVQTCSEQEKVGGLAESDPHTQPQCTTVQPQEMLLTSEGEGKNMLKHSFFQFPWFPGVSVFDDDPKKNRRLRPELVNNQKDQNILGV